METIRLVYPVEGGDLIEAGEASSKMKLTLKKLGLPQDVIRRASICMYEGEINMVIHADGGQAEVEVDANQIVIRMTDTGPGIPLADQETVFERFVKLDTFTQGTGLGLSVCKSIAEQLGGSVGLESAVGEGSCFRLDLPARG